MTETTTIAPSTEVTTGTKNETNIKGQTVPTQHGDPLGKKLTETARAVRATGGTADQALVVIAAGEPQNAGTKGNAQTEKGTETLSPYERKAALFKTTLRIESAGLSDDARKLATMRTATATSADDFRKIDEAVVSMSQRQERLAQMQGALQDTEEPSPTQSVEAALSNTETISEEMHDQAVQRIAEMLGRAGAEFQDPENLQRLADMLGSESQVAYALSNLLGKPAAGEAHAGTQGSKNLLSQVQRLLQELQPQRQYTTEEAEDERPRSALREILLIVLAALGRGGAELIRQSSTTTQPAKS